MLGGPSGLGAGWGIAIFVARRSFGGTCSIPGSRHRLLAGRAVLLGCVRPPLTCSLWWGIGLHTAFDWAESFFYGTANSAKAPVVGHLIASHPTGDARFSGGAVGPDGSFICAGLVVLFILIAAAAARLKR